MDRNPPSPRYGPTYPLFLHSCTCTWRKTTIMANSLVSAKMPCDSVVKPYNLLLDTNLKANISLTGRSLSSCQMAFNQMHQSYFPDQRPPQHFRPESSSSSAHMSPYQAPSLSRKRPIEPLHKSTPSTPRAIQPRPPTSGGIGGGGPFNGSSSVDSSAQAAQISPGLDTSMSEPRRKRGRPSKEETLRRMEIARARGEEYPPPKRKPGPKAKNRPVGSSPRTTTGNVGGGENQGSLLSTTSRLQSAIGMESAPQSSNTLPGEPSPASSRLRNEHMDRSAPEQQHQPAEPQDLRQDQAVGSSPRTQHGGTMYPRVIGQDESGGGGGGGSGSGGGGGPLSTPRTILASQMSAQPVSSPYVPSFRGINEIAAAGAGPNPSVAQGMRSGSPHRIGQSPTVTMAGESNPGGMGQKYQIGPGPGPGGGSGSGGGGKKS